MELETRLMNLKLRIEELQKSQATTAAKLEVLRENLKEKWGVDTVKDGVALLRKKNSELDELGDDLNTSMEHVEAIVREDDE